MLFLLQTQTWFFLVFTVCSEINSGISALKVISWPSNRNFSCETLHIHVYSWLSLFWLWKMSLLFQPWNYQMETLIFMSTLSGSPTSHKFLFMSNCSNFLLHIQILLKYDTEEKIPYWHIHYTIINVSDRHTVEIRTEVWSERRTNCITSKRITYNSD
jgi:hypothetical protein